MTTSAQRREQLESHLRKFREIADNRVREKIAQWGYYLPAAVSATLLICQVANTIIFFQFAYNFGQLYVLLDEYMRETDAKNITLPNSTEYYRYNGINAERINEIDSYHDDLWTLFVAEVIQLIFPFINILLFAWVIQDKKRHLSSRVQVIYLLCPALALVLSISQACTIHVTLTESIYTIRFLLAKLLGVLLELNKPGRLPIEAFFECEFFNDDDIVKPPCAGQLHDTVVSRSTLTILIVIHVIPVIAFLYLILKNLKSQKSEHLFLYIESVDENGRRQPDVGLQPAAGDTTKSHLPDEQENWRSFRETITHMLGSGFKPRFVPKRVKIFLRTFSVFHNQLFRLKGGSQSKCSMSRQGADAAAAEPQTKELDVEDGKPETAV